MNKKFVFLALILIGWVAILYKTIDTDSFYKRNIVMKVFFKEDLPSDDNSEAIKTIFNYGNKGFKHTLYIDQINFYVVNDMLKHPHLDSVSKLNLKKDLFLDFEISMNVLKEGFYDIIVKSNEIIALALDGKEIGKFEESSDVTENKVTAFLSKGHHSLYLVYLQAIGAKGIEALYKPVEDKGSGNLIGVDTDSISFSGITQ